MKFLQTLGIFVSLLLSIPLSAQFNYGEALQKSLFFYEVQQSGPLPEWNRVSWRADATINDGSDVGLDLNGGWFDAGDHVKFNFPMAFSVTALAWGGIEYKDAYSNSGQLEILKRNLKFVADYFLKCHTAPNELWGQVGNGGIDHGWWGSSEVYPRERPSYKIDEANPGSDLAAETAAAMAAVSILLKDDNPSYSATLVEHAKQLYNFADKFRDEYSNSITDAAGFYRSFSSYQDELVWGAIWMYKATNDPVYLAKAEAEYDNLQREGQSSIAKYKEAFSWDDKAYGCYVALAQITGKQKYIQDAERNLDYFAHNVNGESVPTTPGGLPHLRQWGTIRYASNQSLLALIYGDKVTSDPVKKERYADFGKRMVDYALGDNPINRSFMNGFGNNPANDPHHRGNSGNWTNSDSGPPNVASHILYGAVVGGPKNPDNDEFEDDRGEFVANEVACDYNACITGVLARMYGEFGGIPLANFPVAEVPSRAEIRSFSKFNSNNNLGSTISVNIQNRTAWPARRTDKLSYRYYFDISEAVDAGFSINDYNIQINNLNSNAKIEIKQYDGTVYFAEIVDLPSIAPIGDPDFRTETRINIRIPNGVPYDITNDWSAQGLFSGAVESTNIPVYDNGVLVFGNEPDRGDVPNAAFTATPESGTAPLTVSFDASNSSDPNGDALTYSWDFGNGKISDSVTADVVYSLPGIYLVSLTVSDETNTSSAATKTIVVEDGNIAPSASFTTTPSAGIVPVMVSFDASASSDENGDSLNYSWDFGDGQSASGVTVSHLYDTVGVYTVILRVSDGSKQDTAEHTVTVTDGQPIAAFTLDNEIGVLPFTINVDASASVDPTGGVLTYDWDFGNGYTADTINASATYTAVGNYVVTLTVSNTNGAAIATKMITVTDGTVGCTFNTPLSTALPTIHTSFSNSYVLGDGGPDLSNVINFVINWDLQNNGLYQFSMNTNNGVPSWWNDFLPKVTQNFNSAQPLVTINNSGFPNLDGSYWATVDNGSFVLVSQDRGFTIYFSDSAPTNCSDRSNKLQLFNQQPIVSLFPNPVKGKFVIEGSRDLTGSTIDIYNILGKKVMSKFNIISSKSIGVNISSLNKGIYFVKINNDTISRTFKIEKL